MVDLRNKKPSMIVAFDGYMTPFVCREKGDPDVMMNARQLAGTGAE